VRCSHACQSVGQGVLGRESVDCVIGVLFSQCKKRPLVKSFTVEYYMLELVDSLN